MYENIKQSVSDRQETYALDHSIPYHSVQILAHAAKDRRWRASNHQGARATLPEWYLQTDHALDYRLHWDQKSSRKAAPKALTVFANHTASTLACFGYHHT